MGQRPGAPILQISPLPPCPVALLRDTGACSQPGQVQETRPVDGATLVSGIRPHGRQRVSNQSDEALQSSRVWHRQPSTDDVFSQRVEIFAPDEGQSAFWSKLSLKLSGARTAERGTGGVCIRACFLCQGAGGVRCDQSESHVQCAFKPMHVGWHVAYCS